MKKVLYFMGFMLAMASCTENDESSQWANPMANDPEAAKTVELTAEAAPAIDYATIDDVDNATVQLFVPTIVAEDEATATYEAVLYSADKAKSVALDAGTDGTVSAAELQTAMITLYGNNGDTHEVPVDVKAAAVVAGLGMNLAASTTATVTLVAPEFADYIYGIGQVNGTNWDTAFPLYGPNFDGKYEGFLYLDGEFKFRSHADSWDAPDWGAGDGEGTLTAQAGNLSATAAFYKVNVDLAAMTYELTEITTIGVIGGFEGNNWSSDVASLTYDKEAGCWKGTAEIPAGVEFKFRANNDWPINWGGSIDNLTQDGGNLTVAETGTYDIQLFVTYAGAHKAVLTKQ